MECLFANIAAGVRMGEPHATGSMIGSQNNRTDSPFDWVAVATRGQLTKDPTTDSMLL
jgi:hypothetical protein